MSLQSIPLGIFVLRIQCQFLGSFPSFLECGLYEASDLLLGDHLTENSDTVMWIDVSMSYHRSRRLKNLARYCKAESRQQGNR